MSTPCQACGTPPEDRQLLTSASVIVCARLDSLLAADPHFQPADTPGEGPPMGRGGQSQGSRFISPCVLTSESSAGV